MSITYRIIAIGLAVLITLGEWALFVSATPAAN
jgi:hypothetical protein